MVWFYSSPKIRVYKKVVALIVLHLQLELGRF